MLSLHHFLGTKTTEANKSLKTEPINKITNEQKDFLANSYFIVQINPAKSFKMKCIRSLYFNFLLRYS